MNTSFLRTVGAIFRKDLAVWLRNGRNIATTLLPPLVFLLVQALGAAAVGRSPVALVTLDTGPQGREMQQIFHNADVFRITDATPVQAQLLLKDIQVAAVITILPILRNGSPRTPVRPLRSLSIISTWTLQMISVVPCQMRSRSFIKHKGAQAQSKSRSTSRIYVSRIYKYFNIAFCLTSCFC